MNYNISTVFSFSIFIAGIIALVRYRKINKAYRPFLFCIWVACLNELLSFVLIKGLYTTQINNNIYVLFESLLIVQLFKNLELLRKPKGLYTAIVVWLISLWIGENFIFGKITNVGIYFRIFYSLLIVLMSINYINRLIGSSSSISFRDSGFLLCIGFILYFTYKVLVHSFWLYGLNSGQGFLMRVYMILIYINLFVNLIYAIAVAWMPSKQEFTLPS